MTSNQDFPKSSTQLGIRQIIFCLPPVVWNRWGMTRQKALTKWSTTFCCACAWLSPQQAAAATEAAEAEDLPVLGCTQSTTTFSCQSSRQLSACDSGIEKLSLKSPELQYYNIKKSCDPILLPTLSDINETELETAFSFQTQLQLYVWNQNGHVFVIRTIKLLEIFI